MILFDERLIGGLLLASILFWKVIPARWRTGFLIAGSAATLALIQPWFTAILAGLVVATYYLSLGLTTERRGRRLLLGILLLVAFLLIAKYGGLLLGILFSGESKLAKTYLVPLGVSYLSFKLIAYVIDVYRGVIPEPRLTELFAFIFFVPTFPAGPIERYQNFAGSRAPRLDVDLYTDGLRRLALGYFKKVVIVNFLFNETLIKKLYPAVMAQGVSLDLPAWMVLAFLLGSLLYAYVDLSSYADIAIGYGQLFGYRTMENMRTPIFTRNLSDYWSRWHISLSSWCRNNVYFPILAASRNNHLALYASFIVMGLWHNVSLNWLIWGIWHATGITIYSKWNRFVRRRKPLKNALKGRLGHGLGMALTMLYSALGFAFIMTDSRTDLLDATAKALRLLAAIVV